MPLTPEEQKELAELEAWEASTKPKAPTAAPTAPSKLTPDEEKELAELEAWEASSKPQITPAKPKTEGTFGEHLDTISKKYKVSPEILRKYALDIGSFEAAKDTQEKMKAGLGATTESMFMGLPGKLERTVTGAVGGKQYAQALDEVTDLVNERKSTTQKVGELGAGFLLPSGAASGVAKGLGTVGKLGVGAATGAVTGAAAGLGASKAGEEVPGIKTGAGIGAVTGGVVAPVVGTAIKKAVPTIAEGAMALVKPKAAEKAQMLVRGEQAKLPQVVQGVVDYAQRQTQEGQKVRGIFKAKSRQELISNINTELSKIGGDIDEEIMINMVDKNTGTLHQNLTKRITELADDLEAKLETGAISKAEFKTAMKTLDERVISNIMPFGDKTSPDIVLRKAIDVRRGLQEAAKRAYEPGKRLSPSDQLMKDMAAKVNEAIYESMPSDRLQKLNRDYSNLTYYRDALSRGEAKSAMDALVGALRGGAADVAVSLTTSLPPGVITAAKVAADFAKTDYGRLLRMQVGQAKANEIADKAIREAMKGYTEKKVKK